MKQGESESGSIGVESGPGAMTALNSDWVSGRRRMTASGRWFPPYCVAGSAFHSIKKKSENSTEYGPYGAWQRA